MKTYDMGCVKCTLTKTQRDHYRVTAEWDGHKFSNLFKTKEEALEEILSYAEIEEDD